MMRSALALLVLAAPLAADDWPMWGGRPDRNMVSPERNLPASWPKGGGKQIKWAANLGSTSYGNPVVAGGRIYIGTNNGAPRDPAFPGDKGVLMCFAEKDGAFLWQAVHDKLPTGDAEDYSRIGICSTPCVVGDRLYYVSNRAELVCLNAADGARVWSLDFRRELGVSLHQAASSSPLVLGDLVFVHSGQGTDLETKKVKNPAAPSFVAVHRDTGKLAWQDASPGSRLLSGQWSSPAAGVVDGVPQVVFPGGDGRLYAFEAKTGKPLWTLDAKPKDGNHFVATPVFAGHRVLVAVGQDPEAGVKPGCLLAVDARRGQELWRVEGEAFGCSISTVAVDGDLVYAADFQGILNCLELETGKKVWSDDLFSTVWGSPLVADGKVYLRNGDGDVVVYAAGREKKKPVKSTLPGLGNGSCVAANGVLYVAGDKRLYAMIRGE